MSIEDADGMVTVYRTHTGEKYHLNRMCGRNPWPVEVTREQFEQMKENGSFCRRCIP